PLSQFSGVGVHKSNLLEGRVVIASYNHHVRLLSPEPFGWFAPPKLTRAWEPTLLWNQLHSLTAARQRPVQCFHASARLRLAASPGIIAQRWNPIRSAARAHPGRWTAWRSRERLCRTPGAREGACGC